MSVHDAEVDDIYVDKQGKLWRCVTTCQQPTVTFEAVEGYVPSANPAGNAAAQFNVGAFVPHTPEIVKPRCNGGIGGLMWEGWKRIWRPDSAR